MLSLTSPNHPLVLAVLRRISSERLQRAWDGLFSGYQVRITKQEDAWLSGTVLNGDGKEYKAVIGERALACSCPDFIHTRGQVCKHLAMLVLHPLKSLE